MSWKARAGVIATAWIVIPWTWSIVAWQIRSRRGAGPGEGEGEDEAGGPPVVGAPASS